MKLTNINTILTYISLILAIAILLSVIFGCYFKKKNVEHFSSLKKDDEEKMKEEKNKKDKNKDNKNDLKNKITNTVVYKEDDKNESGLSKFESGLVEGLSSGKMNSKDIETHIKSGEFTKENLENIINHIEKIQSKEKKSSS